MFEDEVTTYELAPLDDFGSGGGPDFGVDPRGDPRQSGDEGPVFGDDPNGVLPESPPAGWDYPSEGLPEGGPVLELTPVAPPSPPNIGAALNGLGVGALLIGGIALFFLFKGRGRR